MLNDLVVLPRRQSLMSLQNLTGNAPIQIGLVPEHEWGRDTKRFHVSTTLRMVSVATLVFIPDQASDDAR